MTYLSILEKLEILFNTLMDLEFVLVFALLILFFTLLYTIKKLSGTKYILYIFLTFTLLFGISIVKNYDILSNTFENFTTIFFSNIYFPSIYVYIGSLVVSFITFITSMLNVMLKKVYKVINSIMFALNNILFVVILNIIAKNKIDIFSVNSLYTNTNLVAILELSMGLCIVWLLSLLIVYITNVICDRMANKRIINEEPREIFNPIIEINDNIISDVNNEELEEPIGDNKLNYELTSIVEDNNENLVEVEEMTTEENEEIQYIENNEEPSRDNRVTFNDILNGCIPVTYYDNSIFIEEYNLINPQLMYEDNYNKIKNDIVFNDINITLNEQEEISPIIENIEISNNTEENNTILTTPVIEDFSIEELTLKEKKKVSKERLISNTISLNDLIEEDNNIDKIEYNIDESDIEEYKDYTIDDYKRIVKMLNSLKEHSNSNDIKIDDAVAMSLISNYSIDDCLKFKKILENNLN